MATPQDWRDLRERFAALAALPPGARSLGALLDPENDAAGVLRRWHLQDGSESLRRDFKRLARAGARLLGYPQRPKQDEWRDWLNSLRAEPLLSDHVRVWMSRQEGLPDDPHSWEMDHVCAASAEFCTFMAGGIATGKLVVATHATPAHDLPLFPRRAAWLKNVLAELALTPYSLRKSYEGPDPKTTHNILAGHKASDGALDTLANALTNAGRPTTTREIPSD
jgi:hypothetical protein